ncbi:MAG: hypothetical protein SFH39_18015 [Candidatus Magnetobacterium sp. LHC-1]|uniref:Uncharacterized protein n=1 Tax=Candidatus Magnetobacterium casense TaxID=1455061 RepID=A0ABS6S3H7_9BACT|nr:hypothetical protein [Candidatus Magnetobacterium casensis]MBF0606588.1 hypothetical protein [Nitrospirota bacterium]MBV6343150.1 hypothetical protein [Candidatus Magnetobacterium casensis]
MSNVPDKVKALLRFLKKDCGVRFIVRQMSSDTVVLIVFNRGQVDASMQLLLAAGICDPDFDIDGGVIGFSVDGVRFHLLSKEGCG